ncbi:MAG: hypothetical protein QOF57_2865 [Frankiaceae bacterium]|jgi:hypothetical protein|nr:hypothetical protein [Frankiaceae bacterium]MDQ1727022.1 hypothetical protein [Frankiaceae bacterium]
MGEDLVRTARTGAGEAHAVAADGDRSTAACGRIVRMVVRDAWPPAFGDDVCPHCERVTTDVAELYGDITSL